jgi:hypothetical protein
VYLSKIWFLVVAAVAAVTLALALVMPRPAQRQALAAESRQLHRACTVANILLRDNARTRVQLAGEFARAAAPANEPGLRLDAILFSASKGEIISAEANATGRKALANLLDSFSGNKPDFVWLLDQRGRVVARASKSGKGDERYGENVSGYFVVQDALAGYLRDDLWIDGGELSRIAASPVVTRQLDWAGAVVIGHAVSKDFVTSLSEGLDVQVSFYAGAKAVATSDTAAIHDQVLARLGELAAIEPGSDCVDGEVFTAEAEGKTYAVMMSRLPGEAGELGAFYAVFAERPSGIGFAGTVKSIKRGDLSFSNFPWILLALLFLLMVGLGMFIMVWEGDRPLRRLTEDAQRLSRGDSDRLHEELHSGKIGSVARSVNVALDRLRREAKSAQKDLDDLLGPAPAGAAKPLPASTPRGAPAASAKPPPPPSEFRFSDSSGARVPKTTRPPTDAQIPPPPVALPLPGSLPAPRRVATPLADEDEPRTTEFNAADYADPLQDPPTLISEASQKLAVKDAENQHFRQIYEEFLATKRSCGEAAEDLTFEKFATKLRKNRDALIARHGCRSVRFQVYVKDGKAALKASPVR